MALAPFGLPILLIFETFADFCDPIELFNDGIILGFAFSECSLSSSNHRRKKENMLDDDSLQYWCVILEKWRRITTISMHLPCVSLLSELKIVRQERRIASSIPSTTEIDRSAIGGETSSIFSKWISEMPPYNATASSVREQGSKFIRLFISFCHRSNTWYVKEESRIIIITHFQPQICILLE